MQVAVSRRNERPRNSARTRVMYSKTFEYSGLVANSTKVKNSFTSLSTNFPLCIYIKIQNVRCCRQSWGGWS